MRVCFNGCSFTVGEGFPSDQRDRYIYDRLVSKKFNFDSDNIAVGGSSNHKIFMRSSAAMLSNKYDLVITQWTALNRIWLSPGPDANFFVNDTSYPDYRYRDFYLSSSQKQFIRNTLLLMNHDYQNIIDLVDYCKILAALETTTTKAIFINGLVPWNSDLVDSLSSDLSSCLSSYSKELLDFNNRSDQEIIEIFEKLQHKFTELDQSRWVNLFESFQKNTTDCGPENHHPGPNSHEWMAQQVENFLKIKHI